MPDSGDDPDDRSPDEPEGAQSKAGADSSSGESTADETTVSSGAFDSTSAETSTGDRTAADRPIIDRPRADGPAPDRSADPPSDTTSAATNVPAPSEQPIRWYLTSTNGWVLASRDIMTSLLAVVVIGLVLFAISGVWPPLVAIESGSMEDNMHKGDLVFLVEADRYPADGSDENGIVTTTAGADVGHESFNNPGDVIVYKPDGRVGGTPIIHRARFHVTEGEDWYGNGKADPDHIGTAQSCSTLRYCEAPQDGYITKGDANRRYDQVGTSPQSTVVKSQWVEGKAVARVPWLGCIRLELTGGASCLE
jgi:signal peptidase